jgi:cation diffusion facilitator family transporter
LENLSYVRTATYNLKIQKWITLLSVVLFLAKIAAYFLTHSLAILSDALESIVNVIAGFVGLYSLFVAAKPSDEDHPYGHGKAEFVSAAVEGGLIVAAGILILFETARNFITPSAVTSLDSGLILVGISAVVNYIAGAVCLKVAKKNKSLALQASGKHLQTDTYSTLAVIAGLGIMLLTKIYWLDKIIAIAMSGFIMYNGYTIIRQSLAGIMDQQDMQLLRTMVNTLNEHRKVNWIDLHNLRVIKYGSQLHIDCHLTVPWYLNVDEAHVEIDELIRLVRTEFGDTIEFFVHTDGCRPFSCPICDKGDCPVRQHPFNYKVEWTVENLLSNKKHRLKTEEV